MVGCSSQEGSSVCRQLRHAVMMTLEGQTTWCAAPALQLREQRAPHACKTRNKRELTECAPLPGLNCPAQGPAWRTTYSVSSVVTAA